MKKIIIFSLIFLIIIGFLFKNDIYEQFYPSQEKKFLILYTNDEHGHLWDKPNIYRAAILEQMWEKEEQQCKNCEVFKISGGDNFSGSAISSLFKGESMALMMSQIGYELVIVGNHEFDYGMESLKQNIKKSDATYISANILSQDLENVFPPYKIIEKNKVKFAFIGLTTSELKKVSLSKYTASFDVVNSFNVANRFLRRTKLLSNVQIIIAHEPLDEATKWAKKLEIKPLIIFNGHSHKKYIKKIDSTLFIQGGKYLRNYAVVEIVEKNNKFKITRAEIKNLDTKLPITSQKALEIKDLTDLYLTKLERVAGEQIGFAKKNISKKDFQKFYACAQKAYLKNIDIAISNPGGFRDKIFKGKIKKSDIISILPFENRIVITKIKGKNIIKNLELSENCICGAKKIAEQWFVKGKTIEKDKYYNIANQEFIFGGGDYYNFKQQSSSSSLLSISWRVPVIKELKKGYFQNKSFKTTLQTLIKQFDYPN